MCIYVMERTEETKSNQRAKKRRRRALIYRPSPEECSCPAFLLKREQLCTPLHSPGSVECERTRVCSVEASILERERKRMLAVELRDVSRDVGAACNHWKLSERCFHEAFASPPPCLQRAELRPQAPFIVTSSPGSGERRRGADCPFTLEVSPLEREHEQLLTVELRDVSKEAMVETLHVTSQLTERTALSENWTKEKRQSCPDASMPFPCTSSSPSPSVGSSPPYPSVGSSPPFPSVGSSPPFPSVGSSPPPPSVGSSPPPPSVGSSPPPPSVGSSPPPPSVGSSPPFPSVGSSPPFPSVGSSPPFPSAGSSPPFPSAGSSPPPPSVGSSPPLPSVGSTPPFPYDASSPPPPSVGSSPPPPSVGSSPPPPSVGCLPPFPSHSSLLPLPSPETSHPPLHVSHHTSPSHISHHSHTSLKSPFSISSTITPKLQGWSLTPLLHSVRSKLESFADIFLTPIKGLRDSGDRTGKERAREDELEPAESVQDTVEGPSWGEQCVLESPTQTLEPAESRVGNDFIGIPPVVYSSGENHTNAEASVNSAQNNPESPSSGTGMNIHLKIAISSPASPLCRPPLQRCVSCPSLTLTPVLPLRGAVTSPRLRRHSLGTVEESEVLARFAFPLTCLRKEKHPHLVCSGGSPGSHHHLNLYSTASPGTRPRPSLFSASSPEPRHQQKGVLHTWRLPLNPSMCLDAVNQQPRSPDLRSTECRMEEASLSDSELKESGKVSKFQIRKRPTRQEGNLTPLGLPKRARLQKEEFSLEEIYTNKNYRTPTEKRTFETIFEEPVLKGGTLVLTSQRPLRRLIVFRDSSALPRQRKKKKRGGGRSRRGALSNTEEIIDLDVLLQKKLSQLEAALQGEEVGKGH